MPGQCPFRPLIEEGDDMQCAAIDAGSPHPVVSPFNWTSASHSHAGCVRRVNEDACLNQPARGLWAVADGMGGHSLGQLASRTVVERLGETPECNNLGQFVLAARDRLQLANRQLLLAASQREVAIIGSTVAALLAVGRHCAYLWAGDSRIYLCRNRRLKLLTRDHSHLEEVRSQRDPNVDDTMHRPPANLITRAVGVTEALELDAGAIEVLDGDVFLICSDGLTNEVHDLEIGHALLPGNCQQAVTSLLRMALERGGHDNVTAVVIRAEDLESSDRTVMNPFA